MRLIHLPSILLLLRSSWLNKQSGGRHTVNQYNIRKSAYSYICERLNQLPTYTDGSNELYNVSLEELKQLKEGLMDPSPVLVADIKKLFCPIVGEAEIDSHLVTPFQHRP